MDNPAGSLLDDLGDAGAVDERGDADDVEVRREDELVSDGLAVEAGLAGLPAVPRSTLAEAALPGAAVVLVAAALREVRDDALDAELAAQLKVTSSVFSGPTQTVTLHPRF